MYGRILLGAGGLGRSAREGHDERNSVITIQLDKMSLSEKLEAMEAIWADLSRTPGDVPVPEWHCEVLRARRETPATWLDWEHVKESLRQRAQQEGTAEVCRHAPHRHR
jgi:hypothetical protein